jgi:hypothetical protein
LFTGLFILQKNYSYRKYKIDKKYKYNWNKQLYLKMSKFDNIKDFLLPEYNLESNFENFKNNKIIFKCKSNHINELSVNSFQNKRYKISKEDFCSTCKEEKENKQKFEIFKQEIENKNGHILLELGKDRKVVYKCGNCHIINHSSLNSLQRSTGYCLKCQNDKNKIKFEDLINIVKENKCELLMKEDEYKNNKQKLKIRCECGKINFTVLSDIKRGKKCLKCKIVKYKETCEEKYGVDNVFKSEEIKEKIKETNNLKLGVDYPMQNEEVQNKAMQTCLDKYGVKWAFCQDYVYEKIRNTHLNKYGVKYPLQCKEIQEKIEKIFIEKYGVKRPLLSKIILQKMKEKYGSEYFINSSHFKDVMIQKHGVEHALQYPEFFHKMIKSSFSNKNYTFKNGRQIQVMGYENYAIDYILSRNDSILKRKVNEDEIVVGKDIQSFEYYDDENKKHRYYPDIYIKDTKLLFEVKSIYIFNKNPKLNYLKFKQVQKEGFDIKVLFFNGKKLIDVWYFLKEGLCKSIKHGTDFEFDKCLEFKNSNIDEIIEQEEDLFYNEIIEDNLEEIITKI